MRRIKLTIAYDGTEYCGWQCQPGAVTVEGTLRKALNKLLGEAVETIGASRTDAGVHAMGNVAVFDTEATIPAEKFCYALNSFLPEDIRVMESEEVSLKFHPRFDCHSKRYEYRITEGRFCSPLRCRYVHNVRHELDTEAMSKAAELLVGTYDFSSFCAAGAQVESKVRTVTKCEVFRRDGEVAIGVEGDGFLYNMVRIIAGTLVKVGEHAMEPEAIPTILEAKDRTKAGPTAPASGLVLCYIRY